MIINKTLIIFDCDGVLFDSHDANIAFFNQCLFSGGYPPLEKEAAEKVVYMSTRQLISQLIPDPAEADRVFRITQETDYTPFISGLVPLFDFADVLGRLGERYHLAVATNRGRSMDRLFNHFGLDRWFTFRVSTVDAEPKPHPEMLLKCIGHFGVTRAESLYLGDSLTDLEAATAAGIDYLWVGGSNRPGIASVADLATL
jgi:phosphoglycolate phosphatase